MYAIWSLCPRLIFFLIILFLAGSRMGSKDTKQIILETAEELFALNGYHSTSLRNITQKAEVNLASVNYHFGSKEDLVVEVINYRLIPLNKIRMQGLQTIIDKAQKNGLAPAVEDIMRAFVEPTLRFRDSAPGVKSFYTLIGRALAEPDNTVRNAFIGHMKPVVILMMDGLTLAMPHIPKQVLFWRLHFAIGSMSHTLRCIGNSPISMDGIEDIDDPEVLIEQLLAFVTAGLEAAK